MIKINCFAVKRTCVFYVVLFNAFFDIYDIFVKPYSVCSKCLFSVSNLFIIVLLIFANCLKKLLAQSLKKMLDSIYTSTLLLSCW